MQIIAKQKARSDDPYSDAALDIINMVRLCEAFGTMPQVGGLLDQDALFVYFLLIVKKYDEVRDELDKPKEK